MSFIALDRSNTGSAKNTPKSDMDLLARIQHLASLNWASHRMVCQEPDKSRPRASRSFTDVGRHYFSPLAVSPRSVAAVKEMVQTLVARWS